MSSSILRVIAMAPIKIVTYSIAEDATDIQGKFLQLRFAGNEYLLFAPKELHRFHNHILARFLEDRELPHRWNDEQTLVLETPAVEVIGGGKFRLGPGTLELFDNSQAYGRFDDRDLIEKIRADRHAWSDHKITIS